MNTKKLFAAAFSALFLIPAAFAQEAATSGTAEMNEEVVSVPERRVIPKVEFSAGLGLAATGNVAGFYPRDYMKHLSPESMKFYSPKFIPGPGGLAGLYVDVNFTENWGLITGFECAFYTSFYKSKNLLNVWHGGTHGEPNQGTDWWVISNLENYRETQFELLLQIPVMAKYMQPFGAAGHHWYVAGGAKLGIRPGYSTYSQAWDKSRYFAFDSDMLVSTGDGKPLYNPTRDYLLSEEGLLSENGAYSAKKKNFYSNQPALDAILSLEGGIRWKLRDGLGLYTGLYFDFGLVRPHQVVDTDHLTNKVLNFDPDNIKYGREYPTVATDNATTHSVVEAVAPDYFYGKDPSPVATEPGTTAVDGVHFIDNPDPFAKTLNRMQAGIKVRFAFGRIKARQKVVRTPKVKPEPAKPTEVPQEIKQTMIELSDALFAFDKFDLNEEARALLDKVTDWLKENPDLKVEIAGHTDSRGSDAYNQKLSENRAKSVYDYIVEHGVDASRLSYKGYGESQPIATNETDEGRQKNRRVELHIIQQESGTE